MDEQPKRHAACQFQSDKPWFDLQYHKNKTIKKPDELEDEMKNPPKDNDDSNIFDRIHGSMIGMALGDALGAFVEFRPHDYMVANPVTTLKGGGTWGLKKGQFTDDTSMALCLANSLVARRGYVPYDQLVRYKWWHQNGYMSSTGSCFDIGSATRQSLVEFVRRQKEFAEKHGIPIDDLDFLSDPDLLNEFDVNCSKEGVAGNGALMRLTPVPMFFHRDPPYAIECSGYSGQITHGDEKAVDACRYYGALIVAAVNGESKDKLLDKYFYEKHEKWFAGKPLHPDIMKIARGSYQKEGHAEGIRGKGYIVSALEAALWAFWSDEGKFETGALAAVNLGDDTDTTAAIYGQLAGAHYGFRKLPKDWAEQVYAKKFIKCLSKWIAYEGKNWLLNEPTTPSTPAVIVESPFRQKTNSNARPCSANEQSGDPKSDLRPRRKTVHDKAFPVQTNLHQQPASTQPNATEYPNFIPSSQRIYIRKDLKSVEDVYRAMLLLGDDYVTDAKKLKEDGIDGYWLLNQVDDEKLIKLGVENKNHRQAILNHIEKLKKECAEQYVAKNQ